MSHTAAENKAQLGWDPDDPHGINPHHDEHHHFIADWRMQVTVLVVLLFFTFLTVAFFRVEAWVEVAFGIHLPGWINIAGAMTIATIKGVLVAAFFMQLKYDKVLNTFVLLFCLLCVGLFLGFAMIDLGSRDPRQQGRSRRDRPRRNRRRARFRARGPRFLHQARPQGQHERAGPHLHGTPQGHRQRRPALLGAGAFPQRPGSQRGGVLGLLLREPCNAPRPHG